ncbi:MAG TPA: DUF5615 family PIN-like protein [Anaerolineales bacterium]|nr:DUF5615 family PIN-like protein [Anaerolineales bacterium]
MIILDENIPKHQRQLLESWRISIRQIGVNVGNTGMKDKEIISFLPQTRRSTFFTRDEDFFKLQLCHARYSLVFLDVEKYETAIFVRRLLRHSDFNTQAKRLANVIRVSSAGISCWRLHTSNEIHLKWE